LSYYSDADLKLSCGKSRWLTLLFIRKSIAAYILPASARQADFPITPPR
jgi:hypothetical protein